jgi:site-specific DNA-methyltransferase (adenine-specific)
MRIETIGNATLYLGDCREILPTLPKVDAVITDPPYGVTSCTWDQIDVEEMWKALPKVVSIMTATQPFAAELIMANRSRFKCEWIWVKNQPSGIASAEWMPMKNHESVLVFCDGKPTYNKQPTRSTITDRKLGGRNGKLDTRPVGITGMKPMKKGNPENVLRAMVNPRSVLTFDIPPNSKGKLHPTQKPVALMAYMVQTYSNEGETILDPYMGSGTTGVACMNLGRAFIGIEREVKYFDIACRRIEDAQRQGRLIA